MEKDKQDSLLSAISKNLGLDALRKAKAESADLKQKTVSVSITELKHVSMKDRMNKVTSEKFKTIDKDSEEAISRRFGYTGSPSKADRRFNILVAVAKVPPFDSIEDFGDYTRCICHFCGKESENKIRSELGDESHFLHNEDCPWLLADKETRKGR